MTHLNENEIVWMNRARAAGTVSPTMPARPCKPIASVDAVRTLIKQFIKHMWLVIELSARLHHAFCYPFKWCSQM